MSAPARAGRGTPETDNSTRDCLWLVRFFAPEEQRVFAPEEQYVYSHTFPTQFALRRSAIFFTTWRSYGAQSVYFLNTINMSLLRSEDMEPPEIGSALLR